MLGFRCRREAWRPRQEAPMRVVREFSSELPVALGLVAVLVLAMVV
jgi:hypothetical protein